jgi:hypothetical protein
MLTLAVSHPGLALELLPGMLGPDAVPFDPRFTITVREDADLLSDLSPATGWS